MNAKWGVTNTMQQMWWVQQMQTGGVTNAKQGVQQMQRGATNVDRGATNAEVQ